MRSSLFARLSQWEKLDPALQNHPREPRPSPKPGQRRIGGWLVCLLLQAPRRDPALHALLLHCALQGGGCKPPHSGREKSCRKSLLPPSPEDDTHEDDYRKVKMKGVHGRGCTKDLPEPSFPWRSQTHLGISAGVWQTYIPK